MCDVSDAQSVDADPTQTRPKVTRVVEHHPIDTNEDGMRACGISESVIGFTQYDGEKGIVPPDLADAFLNDTEQYKLDPVAATECASEMARIAGRGVLVRAIDHPDIIVTDIHSWVLVFKNDKWRAALDTKSVNRRTVNIPFPLPKHSDLSGVISPGRTSFLARDLSDGFYHTKFARKYWGKFAVRHPVTKEVWLFTRPPFGWTLSPWFFTRFSEEVHRFQ